MTVSPGKRDGVIKWTIIGTVTGLLQAFILSLIHFFAIYRSPRWPPPDSLRIKLKDYLMFDYGVEYVQDFFVYGFWIGFCVGMARGLIGVLPGCCARLWWIFNNYDPQ